MAKKGGLGKGLDALFLDNETENSGTLVKLRLSQIEPNKNQPRRTFDIDALTELSESIKEHGIIQPIIVRSLPGGIYQIIAGERRWRASKIAELTEIPAIIIDADDEKVMELALIENLQREDLSPIEEAKGYKKLMETYHFTQEQVSKIVGKSRPVIANSVRLLTLPQNAQKYLEEGKISVGHARVLVGVNDSAKLNQFLDDIFLQELTVRELENLLKKRNEQTTPEKKNQNSWGNTWHKEIEISLQEHLNTKVRINIQNNKGKLIIDFSSKEELEELARRLASI